MRKLILKMDASIDGFVAGPNGELDWIFEHQDEGAAIWVIETISNAGLHVMGRKTFEAMAAHWPRSTEPYAQPMNAIPKLVFTHSSKGQEAIHRAWKAASSPMQMSKEPPPDEIAKNQQSWKDPLVATDLVGEIRRQKAMPGKSLVAYGGASFARDLVKHDLVDEYRFVVRPVVLGKGLRIFDAVEKPRSLKLLTSASFPGGSTAQIFARSPKT